MEYRIVEKNGWFYPQQRSVLIWASIPDHSVISNIAEKDPLLYLHLPVGIVPDAMFSTLEKAEKFIEDFMAQEKGSYRKVHRYTSKEEK